MNAYAANRNDHPVFWTLLSGLVPVPGFALVIGIVNIRRNWGNRGLCVLLGIIALVLTVLWIGAYTWQFGGNSSVHHNQPVKVR